MAYITPALRLRMGGATPPFLHIYAENIVLNQAHGHVTFPATSNIQKANCWPSDGGALGPPRCEERVYTALSTWRV
jgi:hypothetical protein